MAFSKVMGNTRMHTHTHTHKYARTRVCLRWTRACPCAQLYTSSTPYSNMAHPQIMVAVVMHDLRPKFPSSCPEWFKVRLHTMSAHVLAWRCCLQVCSVVCSEGVLDAI